MNETTYMPALITGIIGLFGVILGGFISAYSQRRNNVEQRVHEVRERCAALAKSATHYSASMAQFIRETNEDAEKARQATPDTDLTEELRDGGYWERIGGEVFGALSETIDISLQVAATKDHRVGEQSQAVRLKVIAVHNEVSPVFTRTGSVEDARAEELREEINKEAEILLNMVQPGRAESFWRFRSRKTAVRMRKKERKKKDVSDDQEV